MIRLYTSRHSTVEESIFQTLGLWRWTSRDNGGQPLSESGGGFPLDKSGIK